MSNVRVSIARDLAGKLVGGIVGLAAAVGVAVPADLSTEVTLAVAAGLVFLGQEAYYVLVRLAEERWPAAGRLLLVPRAPVYGVDLPVRTRLVVDDEAAKAAAAHLQQEVLDRLGRRSGLWER